MYYLMDRAAVHHRRFPNCIPGEPEQQTTTACKAAAGMTRINCMVIKSATEARKVRMGWQKSSLLCHPGHDCMTGL